MKRVHILQGMMALLGSFEKTFPHCIAIQNDLSPDSHFEEENKQRPVRLLRSSEEFRTAFFSRQDSINQVEFNVPFQSQNSVCSSVMYTVV